MQNKNLRIKSHEDHQIELAVGKLPLRFLAVVVQGELAHILADVFRLAPSNRDAYAGKDEIERASAGRKLCSVDWPLI